eukprot:TRINITY_DN1893_c0_g1_i6.p1 TRINITY_DN1893_c0_g1~~TRINITY_DN1893_c0_g1_i6.p1  ORF type:complete len:619 (-),score=125.74 TRINITY_DN1893_c0_g1_i6:12-1763(-)
MAMSTFVNVVTHSSVLMVLLGLIVFATADSSGELKFLSDVQVRSPGTSILPELEKVMGSDHRRTTEARVANLEEALRSTFVSLPKNERGALRPPAARHALHRLFMQLHGWQVMGLHAGGDTWDAASPVEALGERLPDDARRLFETRLKEYGLDLHELAVLAATLENMVHAEADVRLAATFQAVEQPMQGKQMNGSEADHVIDTYMASFVMGANLTSLSKEELLENERNILEFYPTWPETQGFLRQVQAQVMPNAATFGFEEVSHAVAEIGEQYGRWQNSECVGLHQTLLEHEEHPNTGRIRLGDFYGLAVNHGKFQFSESVSYLRQLGALDESEPSNLRVMIPNWIYGPNNCLASSGYYAVCCIDVCDGYMNKLERELGSHDASAEQLLQVVAALPDPAADLGGKNRTVSPALQRRLEEIAEHHNGRVPIHGRLFAQWMHHVHPRWCPYPHMSGTIAPRRAEEQEAVTGMKVSAQSDEIRQHMEQSEGRKSSAPTDGMCSSMWSMEEELVDSVAHERAKTSREHNSGFARAGFRGLFFASAIISMVMALAKLITKDTLMDSVGSGTGKKPAFACVDIGQTYAV